MKIRLFILSLFGAVCISFVGCSDPPVSTTAVTFRFHLRGIFQSMLPTLTTQLVNQLLNLCLAHRLEPRTQRFPATLFGMAWGW